MRKVTLQQDAPAHGNWFPRGTGFVVVERPQADVTPPEVDPRTAQAWVSNGWAEDPEHQPAPSDAG